MDYNDTIIIVIVIRFLVIQVLKVDKIDFRVLGLEKKWIEPPHIELGGGEWLLRL